MPNNGYFSCERDKAMIQAGGFFCLGCLVGKPAAEQSPDARYCQGCYRFLVEEAEMNWGRRSGHWKPVKQAKIMGKQVAQVSEDVRGIMATLESRKIEVATIRAADANKAHGKRGPKYRRLPEDLIMRLAGEGMGSKAIVTRLKAELDIAVSYKTIQRFLSGERKQQVSPTSET